MSSASGSEGPVADKRKAFECAISAMLLVAIVGLLFVLLILVIKAVEGASYKKGQGVLLPATSLPANKVITTLEGSMKTSHGLVQVVDFGDDVDSVKTLRAVIHDELLPKRFTIILEGPYDDRKAKIVAVASP